MPSVEHLISLTLDLPPSCIEFWPLHPQYAVVGTYNLEKLVEDPPTESEPPEETREKKTQQRNGSLILLHVQENSVKILQSLSTPSAILDLHFSPAYFPPFVFGAATSTGSIEVYELTDQQGQAVFGTPGYETVIPKIRHLQTLQLASEDTIVTAFSWHRSLCAVGITLSDGSVCLEDANLVDSSSVMMRRGASGMHDLEAWTLAFLPDGSGMYTGGDDSALKNTAVADGYFMKHQWTDRKIHRAGVTAILPFHANERRSLVLTGSYDDHIRLIYASVNGRRTVLSELNLEGGVWRLKFLGMDPNPFFLEKFLDMDFNSSFPESGEVFLLASCMHAGARILKLIWNGEKDWRFEVVAKFEEHKSMNYGSDCQPSLNTKGQRTFISTSFYDRLLCLWRF
ncbi:uncharacterized protein BDR25DRAFT_289800 [Lindgomyces ingoldianus]|uniref:Uncharacterized protein n=1 Tax=Lindgomyces ingoldianus TaxID=673940 RepID=A0ACB6QPF7_9PLEO|nr:uncharacterized protein BDR25DRAFT_289800 [Lindgomyces ingoldianus]KAF2468858.1 hypothetical protein BDR25DRAFT_289800 [Lindgomyces ingoldianus]